MIDDIDGDRICCSTPKNKLLNSECDKLCKSSSFKILNVNFNTLKTDNQIWPNLSKDSLNSNFIHDNASKEIQPIGEMQYLDESLSKDSSEKTTPVRDLSKRQDVVNKAWLRHMRKYYTNIFKRENIKILRSRYWNTKTTEIVRNIKRTFKDLFNVDSLPIDFYHYLIGILKLKDISKMKWSHQVIREVADFHDWLRNYSNIKYEDLFKSEWLRILWRKFVENDPTNEKYQSLIHK